MKKGIAREISPDNAVYKRKGLFWNVNFYFSVISAYGKFSSGQYQLRVRSCFHQFTGLFNRFGDSDGDLIITMAIEDRVFYVDVLIIVFWNSRTHSSHKPFILSRHVSNEV